MQRLSLIGRDFPDLGIIFQSHLGIAQGCISAGKDPDSPSYAYKGHKATPNEDGLVILRQDNLWLLAVADGHLGHESSHALLDGIASLPKIPQRLGPLSLMLASAEWLADTNGGTTLLLACCDESNGSVFGMSFGDSSLITLGESGAKIRNRPNDEYLHGGSPIEVELANVFDFKLLPNEYLVLYTDGVNECCYRDPHRSIRLHHLEELRTKHREDPAGLAHGIADLALQGVDGNPGGQDNIVVAVFPFSSKD